jgi:hypothetical protein
MNMKLHSLITPASLLTAGVFSTSANAATVIETDLDATFGGTQITLAGAPSPQYTFFLEGGMFGTTKAYLVGNDGALISGPGVVVVGPTTSTFSQRYATNDGIFGYEGNLDLRFSSLGVAYEGTAAIVNNGYTIDRITFDAVNVVGGPVAGAVPEPATWAMLILGFGIAGSAMRRARRNQPALATA